MIVSSLRRVSPAARLAARLAVVWAMETVALIALAGALPGLRLAGWRAAMLAVLAIALLNAVLRPLVILLTLPLSVFTFGLLSLPVNAAMLRLATLVVPGFAIDSWTSAFIATVGLAAMNALVAHRLPLDEDEALWQQVARRLARRRRPLVEDSPGLVVIEVDGLSYPALRRALADGDMPTLARWLREGTHRLVAWDCGVPSQTSSSQAGLLHGHNDDIPGFRWYDKASGRLVVSGRPGDAAAIEARLGAERGLLRRGSGFSNVFSGGARRSVMTTSTLAGAHRRAYRYAPPFYGYYLNPYHVGRTLVLLLGDVAREWAGALRARLRRRRPVVGRGGAYPVLRAMSTIVLREMSVQLLTEELAAGVPVNYTSFVGYDVVAHYAGVDADDVRGVLRGIDASIARLERAARRARRPYRLCVLSDHGQSPAIPFSRRHGETLEQLVRRLLRHGPEAVLASVGSDEAGRHAQTLLSEGLEPARAAALARRLEHGTAPARAAAELGDDWGAADPEPGEPIPAGGREGAEVVVCASGNLGLVYFTRWPGRAHLEELQRHHPALVDGLVAHPGVGFVLVRSRRFGAVVLGREGVHHLRDGRVEGRDPLLRYGARAAEHLRRLDGFGNCGDLVVNGALLEDGATVLGFEEQAGTHGGLGGPQTEAFLLHPAEWELGPEPLVGAVAVHEVLRAHVPDAPALAEPAPTLLTASR